MRILTLPSPRHRQGEFRLALFCSSYSSRPLTGLLRRPQQDTLRRIQPSSLKKAEETKRNVYPAEPEEFELECSF